MCGRYYNIVIFEKAFILLGLKIHRCMQRIPLQKVLLTNKDTPDRTKELIQRNLDEGRQGETCSNADSAPNDAQHAWKWKTTKQFLKLLDVVKRPLFPALPSPNIFKLFLPGTAHSSSSLYSWFVGLSEAHGFVITRGFTVVVRHASPDSRWRFNTECCSRVVRVPVGGDARGESGPTAFAPSTLTQIKSRSPPTLGSLRTRNCCSVRVIKYGDRRRYGRGRRSDCS